MRSKIEPIRALADDRLREEEANAQLELLNLRFKLTTRQLANTNEVAKVRRKIAQMKTVLHERSAGGAS